MSRGHRSVPLSWLLVVALIAATTFRIGAAVADSPDPQGADVVYIATGTNFPDALGAGPAAALGNGPILLVQADAVPWQTTTELNRLKPRLIVIVGGTAGVSTSVENTLKGLSFGPTVIRVSGSNRYATVAAISESAFPCDSGMVMAGRDRQGPVCRAALSGNWNLQTVDSTWLVGEYPSLALDAFGNPVIAYRDRGETALKLMHCNDPACSGGDESIVTVDDTSAVGEYTSLVLDASGNPVISYHDSAYNSLKLAHCDDANCAGGGETIVTVDATGGDGWGTSLVLDPAGNPVIAQYHIGATALRLVHCTDPNCMGVGDTIVTVDDTADVGEYPSLVLDAAGNPVISYFDRTNTALKLVHCDDPKCSAGGESIVTVDDTANVGWDTSIALDASGNPVISYYDVTNTALKVAHCNDPNCSGGGESIVTVDDAASVGSYTSLVLDAAGNPVISYFDRTNTALKLVHCDDPNCAPGGGSIITVDNTGWVGEHTSLVLDAAGNPVISYFDYISDALKVASF